MNLFMHYTFDRWMHSEYRECPFARYADDAVVHCRSEAQAQAMMRHIAARLGQCGLEMHPEKSKIVYCKDSNRRGAYPVVQFTFLGFTFRPRKALNRDGKLFTSFLPGASNEALKRMRQSVRKWCLPRQTPAALVELAEQCNPAVRGWKNYFGAFYPTALTSLWRYIDRKLETWARRKYRTLGRHKRRSAQWLQRVRKDTPELFAHWRASKGAAG